MFQICLKFSNALTSRKYPRIGFHTDYPDECEQWTICLSDYRFDYARAEVQLQALNCQSCGNYHNISYPINIQYNCLIHLRRTHLANLVILSICRMLCLFGLNRKLLRLMLSPPAQIINPRLQSLLPRIEMHRRQCIIIRVF